jgi:hypothetical protein
MDILSIIIFCRVRGKIDARKPLMQLSRYLLGVKCEIFTMCYEPISY